MSKPKSTEPTPEQLWKLRDRLSFLPTLLEAQWSIASSDPQVRLLEATMSSLRAIAENAVLLLDSFAPNCSEPHPRPEDCPCPACRAEVDFMAGLALGPVVSERRELSRSWDMREDL